MKCLITKTSDWKYQEVIEINTLEELHKFGLDNGAIILEFNEDGYDCAIEIYDDYRE